MTLVRIRNGPSDILKDLESISNPLGVSKQQSFREIYHA